MALDLGLDGLEFDFRPPRLILGSVTVFVRTGKSPRYFFEPLRPTQPPTLCGTGNE